VALERLLAAALRDLRRPRAQLSDETGHPLAAASEQVAFALDLRRQHRHRSGAYRSGFAPGTISLREGRGNLTQSLAVGETAVERLYERNAGRVFAYCFVRVGSQSVAEWAVTATFDRARAALANGGLPEQELDWLLRTADKFCAPRLRLRDSALAGPGALVLDDWDGLTFDQIVSRLEASGEALKRARGELSPWRRILGAFNLTPLVSWLKELSRVPPRCRPPRRWSRLRALWSWSPLQSAIASTSP